MIAAHYTAQRKYKNTTVKCQRLCSIFPTIFAIIPHFHLPSQKEQRKIVPWKIWYNISYYYFFMSVRLWVCVGGQHYVILAVFIFRKDSSFKEHLFCSILSFISIIFSFISQVASVFKNFSIWPLMLNNQFAYMLGRHLTFPNIIIDRLQKLRKTYIRANSIRLK